MASFLRSNVLRRGAGDSSVEQSPNPEEPPRRRQQQQQAEMAEQNQEEHSRGGFPFSRRFMPTLFTGQPNTGRQDSTRDNINSGNDDEPKTPRPDRDPRSNRLHIPHITRTWTRGTLRNPSSSTHDDDDDTTPAPRPAPLPLSRGPSSSSRRSSVSVSTARYPGLPTPPAVAALGRGALSPSSPSSATAGGRRRFEGPDPAELHLAALADSGRRRQQRHQQRRQHGHGHGHGSSRRVRGRYEEDEYRSSRNNNSSNGEEPHDFLFCFPWIQSRRLRSQILKCFVSGLLMVVMLSVYLALSMTHSIGTSTFAIMLILLILFATIIFCHGLVRICMLLMGHHQPGGNRDDAERGVNSAYPYMAEVTGPGNHGYAVPRRPIRVVLARDEEAAGVLDDGAGKLEPPAYGAWRESVRVDPNRLFWQRNEDAPVSPAAASSRRSHHSGNSGSDSSSEQSEPRPDSAASARPPSYASEDGVSYVVEARPRSIVPPPLDGESGASSGSGSSSSHLGTSAAAGASSLSVPLTSSSEYGARSGSSGTMWPSSSGGAGPR
ncbi:hypothetical protein SLS62_003096 [Diatrype stigma]|uniref:Uncharacterized protein n=1 Tax=Diatrype stigma TaxID=117547 RepID=A0AAN9YUF1_9PEZI